MADAQPKTGTDVPSKSSGNVSEVPTAVTEPKTKPNVLSATTTKSTGNVSEVPKAGTEPKTETDAPPTDTSKSTAKVSQIKTVKVSNVSMSVTKKDIWEFFTFSGDIHYIEIKSESNTTQNAFVTFKDSQGADTAVLLTGATIADLAVSVTAVENYQLPADAPPLDTPDAKGEVVQKAEEVVSTMLAKGFVLGKDALQKAKSFDEKHQFTTNASAKVADLDRRMGLSQKLKEVNERYQVSEKTQSAIAVAEQKANTAGTALMSNPYVSSGAVWVSGAFAAITKAAENVGSKTKEKVEQEEKERSNSNSTTNSTTVNNSDNSLVKDPSANSSTVKKGDDTLVKDPSANSTTVKKSDEASVKDTPANSTTVKKSDEASVKDPSIKSSDDENKKLLDH